jgi:type II secretory pathway component PulM
MVQYGPMTLDREILMLGGLIVLLVAVIVLAVFCTRRRTGGATRGAETLGGTGAPEDVAPWVLEGQRLFHLWQERIERLNELKARLSGMAQEIEQLRTEIGHMDAMRAQITRLAEENERYRVELDHLREMLARIAGLAHEASARPRPTGD